MMMTEPTTFVSVLDVYGTVGCFCFRLNADSSKEGKWHAGSVVSHHVCLPIILTPPLVYQKIGYAIRIIVL